jgi:hypothetical protein
MDSSDYTVSYQTSGDTPLAGFNVTVTTAGMIQVTLASSSVAGFVSANINYALNAPAVGATFPLSIDASTVTTGTVSASRLPVVVPGTSAGVVAAAGLPGNTTGSAIASGYVGEVVSASLSNVPVGGAGVAVTVGTISLNKGIYLVYSKMALDWSINPSSFSSTYNSISTTAATHDFTNLVSDQTTFAGGAHYGVATAVKYVVIAADSTPVYSIMSATYSGGTGGASRAGTSQFFAVRIT